MLSRRDNKLLSPYYFSGQLQQNRVRLFNGRHCLCKRLYIELPYVKLTVHEYFFLFFISFIIRNILHTPYQPYFEKLSEFVREQREKTTIYPKPMDVFNWAHYNLRETKEMVKYSYKFS